MTGDRLLLFGGPDREATTLAARLSTPDRRCRAFSLETALAANPDTLPEVAIIALAGPDSVAGAKRLLAAWEDRPVHVLFLAPTGLTIPSPATSPLRVLRDLPTADLAVLLDIVTERDRARRQAQEQNAWREAFLAGFSGFVMACDPELHVVFANEAAARRAGGNPLGKPCYATMHGRSQPCPWCARDKAGFGHCVTMEVQSPLDGRFFSMVSTLLPQPGGTPLLLTLFHDVTDRNMAIGRLKALNRDLERRVAERTETLTRQTEQLAEANVRLRELDALKSGFLATVTHDLRTPLTSVLGFAKLTRRDFVKDFMPFSEVSDKLRRKGARIAGNLSIIETEGARLTRLVNDFLDLSKIEAGRLDWNDQDIDPAAVIRTAVAAVSGEYEQKEGLALVVDIPQTLPRLRLDPDRFMQVLVNLLTNAVRYTAEGEVTLTASCLSRTRMEFRVADTGPGIPEPERLRVFDKFYRTRRGNTTSADPKGTGLGLAICKQIVERYGGTIRAEGRDPHGTVFVVELPIPAATSGIPPLPGDRDHPDVSLS